MAQVSLAHVYAAELELGQIADLLQAAAAVVNYLDDGWAEDVHTTKLRTVLQNIAGSMPQEDEEEAE